MLRLIYAAAKWGPTHSRNSFPYTEEARDYTSGTARPNDLILKVHVTAL